MKRSKVRFFCVTLELALFCAVLLACGSSPAPASALSAAPADELDAAIRETSDYLNKQLSKGNKLMILNVQSDFPALSEYIIDELIANTVNDRVFSVVDRQQLNTIRAELEFQTSGEVDDDTAQLLGRMAGAQIIVSGAVSQLGDLYRLRVRALSVQSAQIEGQFNRNIPEGTTISALVRSRATGYGGESQGGAARNTSQTVPAGTTAAAAPAPAEPAASKTYQIGDEGPAGGLIFYDKGNSADGWRYLEAAPASTEGKGLQWSVSAFDTNAKGSEVGTGKQNTRNIMDASVQVAVNAPAVRLCDRLEYGGYDDWYLPSKNELGLMYMNLKVDGIGGFGNEWYWSSSESGNSGGVWTQHFGNGQQNGAGDRTYLASRGVKGYEHNVRAIRQF